ncbi:MAG TPA: ATP-binding protein [Gemmatimonadaceae bacterium]|nr:ATP-binding protein [Gemmatimonadaceae bacterium]
MKARLPVRVSDTLTLLTQAVAVLLAAAAVVSPTAWSADTGGLPDALRVLAAFMLAGAAAWALTSASGVRRPLLGGLAVAWTCAALHQIVAGIGGTPPAFRLVTVAGFYLGIGGGCAFALGWRRRGTWRELSLDVAMLACAAAVVGISLGYVVPGAPLAIGPDAAIAFARRSASVAALLVVALLLASHGERIGRTASAGIALGTLALAAADELPPLPASESVRAVLWAAALFAIAYAVRALSAADAPTGLPANGAARRPEITGSATVRARFLLVATGIVTVATFVLGFRGESSPALAVAVAAFVTLLAARTSRLLTTQGEQAQRLARSVEAERALSSTLEARIAERSGELADAERVLQRMWMLGQHVTLELHPARVLERFMEAVLDVAGADGAILGLLVDGTKIRITAAAGTLAFAREMVVPCDETAMGRVIQTGRTLCVDDLTLHPGLIVARQIHGDRSLAIVPLQRRGARIGAVALTAKHVAAFSPEDVARIEAMTDMMSVALANAELVEDLRQAELRFRTLFRAAPDAVFTVQLGGRVQDANDFVREITGLDPAQVVGRDLVEFVAPKDERRLRDALSAAFAGLPARIEVEFRRRTDPAEIRVVALAARRLPETDPPTLLLVGRDTTGEREMRARLMETERLAAVGELVAGVAHEVNNPLSSISAFAQLLLRDGTLNDTQRESVEVIRSETGRASQVVRDLLAFARRSAPQREPLDINLVIERTIRLRNYQLTASNVHVDLSLSSEIPAVTGDARQLQQVVLNLVTNAIQAVAGVGGGTLSIATRADGDRVVLDVADTGTGIPQPLRARVFEPFFTTKPEGEGTGLGLSVSYGIVTAHGGTIRLVDRLDGEPGARFIVTLPAVDAQAVSSDTGEHPQYTRRSQLAGLRVLFVDDEAAIRQGFEAFARLRGFAVVSASDGQSALDALQETSVDAVVSDLRMPGMDGVALYHALLDERPGLAARTVFITGDLLSMGGRGATALHQPVLTKPFSFERLEETLVAIMRGGSGTGAAIAGRQDSVP